MWQGRQYRPMASNQNSLRTGPRGRPASASMTMSRRGPRYRRERLRAQAAERPVLGADADAERRGVEEGEQERNRPQAEDQRKHSDLADDHHVIRVIDEAVWADAYQRDIGQDDDPRRPAIAQGSEDPDAGELEKHENAEPEGVDRPPRRKPPQGREPQRMDRDDQGVMRGANLPRAAREQAPGVAVGQPQLAEALEGNQREDDD